MTLVCDSYLDVQCNRSTEVRVTEVGFPLRSPREQGPLHVVDVKALDPRQHVRIKVVLCFAID